MMRGISGGQRKRVTTGEMVVGAKKTLFMVRLLVAAGHSHDVWSFQQMSPNAMFADQQASMHDWAR